MITFILAIYWSIFMVFNTIIQKDSDHHLLYVVSHVFSHLIHRVSLLPWLLHVFTMYMRAALQQATDYTLKVREQVCLFLIFLNYRTRNEDEVCIKSKIKRRKRKHHRYSCDLCVHNSYTILLWISSIWCSSTLYEESIAAIELYLVTRSLVICLWWKLFTR